MIRLFNSMSREKEIFKPIVPNQVRMYVCGVTVYDDSHIGHARSAVVFDMIVRYFRFRGFEVNLVKNFTDIDDKIIKRSQDDKMPLKELTQKYIDAYHHDMGLLQVLMPSHEPKATEYIEEMIQLIQKLMDKGVAYLSEGDVYYRVEAFKNYGMLSKRDLSADSAGIRVEVSELKENPLDFVLWKSSKPGEPSWNSPWGKGRPGWHIECSAMATKLLGDTLDIHGGGEDLLFPHHENEIAQSEASSGKKFVNYWIHNGFVTVNQEKMSKSLGNFFTIKEIFAKYGYSPEVMGETLRYFILSTHYRQPIQFSDQAIEEAKSSLDRFYILFQKCGQISGEKGEKGDLLNQVLTRITGSFTESMDDDFNTPEAIAHLHSMRNEINKIYPSGFSRDEGKKIISSFKEFGNVLGFFNVSPKEWEFSKEKSPLSAVEIERLVNERKEARQRKDWKRSDEIRKELSDKGVIIEDVPGGETTWRR